nr:MAG TPA: hypothetical protein [Caudoviricetes sp.]
MPTLQKHVEKTCFYLYKDEKGRRKEDADGKSQSQ